MVQEMDTHSTPILNLTMTRRAALGAMGVAAGSLLFGCTETPDRKTYVSPYNWGRLRYTDERLIYTDGQSSSQWGIDVSEHQRAIDWEAVAAAGVQFAFVRIGNRGATLGALNEDACFMDNALGAHRNSIVCSGYFFSQAITEAEAQEEAYFVLKLIRKAEGAGASFRAVAYDHERVNVEEARANDLSGEQLDANTLVFCKTIVEAGYEPLIYGNKRDLLRLSDTVRAAYPLWFAEYDVEEPTAPFDFLIWQYSNAGQIPGISTRVDLNLWLPPAVPTAE